MKLWLQTACRQEVVRRSRRVALLVGTILVLINYTDVLLAGTLTLHDGVKMLLTYMVPYCVSTYASVSIIREHQRAAAGN